VGHAGDRSGLYFSFPVFFVALLDEFGWSRGATAAAFSISSVVQGVLSPVVGILVDRLGPRRIMLGGAGLLGGGVCAGEPDRLAVVALPGGRGAGRDRVVRGELGAERHADRAVVHPASRQHAGAGLSGMGAGVLVWARSRSG